ncbi:MAG: hypothetical protein OXC91_05325 [Rhodobacteraceae bacterium]|nr:hypothetical protein [Paracoccaceae bacterium]
MYASSDGTVKASDTDLHGRIANDSRGTERDPSARSISGSWRNQVSAPAIGRGANPRTIRSNLTVAVDPVGATRTQGKPGGKAATSGGGPVSAQKPLTAEWCTSARIPEGCVGPGGIASCRDGESDLQGRVVLNRLWTGPRFDADTLYCTVVNAFRTTMILWMMTLHGRSPRTDIA